MLGKKEIRRLGEEIQKTNGVLSPSMLSTLEEYRISFKDFLSSAFTSIDKVTRKEFKNSIVTYRIKRFESIINKLIRHDKMCLDRMWDIGGCRCIVNSIEEVYRLRDNLSTVFTIKKENDYYKEPQEDGYKSLHLYVTENDDNSKVIEIQIRNYTSHNWATLVEITDFLYNEKIKEKKSNTQLGLMLLYLSNYNSLEWSKKVELLRIIESTNFFYKLASVFNKNYIEIRKQWTSIEDDINKNYILITAHIKRPPRILVFSTFHEAETAYFEGFDSQSMENRVLTHIIAPRYSKVSVAYSNYVLTYHEFIDEYFSILRDMTQISLQKLNIFRFLKYFSRYRKADNEYILNVRREILAVNNLETKKKGKKEEWINSINKDVDKRIKHRQKLISNIINKMPQNILVKIVFYKLFHIYNIILDKKYSKTKI